VAQNLVSALHGRRRIEMAVGHFDFLPLHFHALHPALRLKPAMKAGIAAYVWSVGEIVLLLGK